MEDGLNPEPQMDDLLKWSDFLLQLFTIDTYTLYINDTTYMQSWQKYLRI